MLKVSGYVRGRALSVNQLIHITGIGDFKMSQVRQHVHMLKNTCTLD